MEKRNLLAAEIIGEIEPNDTVETAQDLGEIGQREVRGVAGFEVDRRTNQRTTDFDTYRFSVSETQDANVQFDGPFVGDTRSIFGIQAQIFELSTNEPVTTVTLSPEQMTGSVALPQLAAGEYYAVVNLVNQTTFSTNISQAYDYSLDITGENATTGDPFEPNDSPEEAAIITLPVNGAIQTFDQAELAEGGDLDYFQFTIDRPGTVMFDTDARELGLSFVDTILTLFDTDGTTQLARNDDGTDPQSGFTGLDSAITVRVEEPGTYWGLVSPFGSSFGEYRLQASFLGDQLSDPFEPNDDFAEAFSIGTLGTGQTQWDGGEIGEAGDDDFFSFSVDGPATISLDTDAREQNLSNVDTVVQLYDAQRFVLASNDDGTDPDSGYRGLDSALEFHVDQAGTYFVQVSGFAGFSTGAYQLEIDVHLDPVDDIYEENNSFDSAAALIVTPGIEETTEIATIDPSGDDDFYAFFVPGPGTITLDTDAREQDLSLVDTVVTLFDESENELARNDDGIDPDSGYRGLDSALSFHVDSGGIYYARVSGFASFSTGQYQLSIDLDLDPNVDPYEDNGSFGTATFLSVNAGVTTVTSGAELTPSGDDDYFQFTVTGPGTISLDTDAREQGLSTVDTVVYLYDASENELARNDDGTDPDSGYRGLDSALEFRVESGGTYFARVSGFAGFSQGRYQLEIDVEPDQTDIYEDNNNFDTAALLFVTPGFETTTIGSTVDPAGDDDYYVITLDASGTVTLDTDAREQGLSSVDTVVYLYDADQNELAVNDDGTDPDTGYFGLDSALQFYLDQPGTYFVRVAGFAGFSTGQYELGIDFEADLVQDPYEENGTFATASFLTVQEGLETRTMGAEINPAGEEDFFQFFLPGPGTIHLDTDAREQGLSLVDTVVTLFNQDEQQLARNDDGIDPDTGYRGLDSALSFFVETGGLYYARVSSFAGSSTGLYDLSIDFEREPIDDPFEENNSFVSAAILSVNPGVETQTFGAGLSPSGDDDYYLFTMNGPGIITLDTDAQEQQLSFVDTVVYLYDSEQNLLGVNDDGIDPDSGYRGLDSALEVSVDAGGTFFARVSGFAGSSTGRYQLAIDVEPTPDPEVPSDPFEVNDSFETASFLFVEPGFESRTFGSSVDPSGDDDYFTFEIGNEGTLTLDTDAREQGLSDVDTVLYLYDAGQNLIAVNDDGTDPDSGFSGLDSALEIFVDQPGIYFARVAGFAGSSTGQYELSVEFDPAVNETDPYEPNNSIEEAFFLTVQPGFETQTTGARIDPAGESDFFEIFLDGSGTLGLDIDARSTELSGLDSTIRVLDSAGNQIAFNDDSFDAETEQSSLDSALEVFIETSGSYFVEVAGYAGFSTGAYDLTLSFETQGEVDPFEPNNSLAEATEVFVTPGFRTDIFGGRVNPQDDDDFYVFDVSGPSTITIDIDAIEHQLSDVDTVISLIASDGTVLAENDDATDPDTGYQGLDSALTFDVDQAGRYFVQVRGFARASIGTYDLGILVDPIQTDVDRFEPNDTFETASVIDVFAAQIEVNDLSIHANPDGTSNEDFFQFTTSGTGTSSDFVGIVFSQAAGDLDISLLDVNGFEIARSQGVDDFELINLAGLPASTYTIQIFSETGGTGAYSLGMNLPVQSIFADEREPNDSFGEASELGLIDGTKVVNELTINPRTDGTSDLDFFRFEIPATGGANDFVGIDFEHAQGDIDLLLFDANQVEIGSSLSASDSESISLDGLSTGVYFVQILGVQDAVNEYTLTITAPIPVEQLEPDNFEPNDSQADARLIESPRTLGELTIHETADVDFFGFTLGQAGLQDNFIELNSMTDESGLVAELFDGNGNVVQTDVFVDGPTTRISLAGILAGQYAVAFSATTPTMYSAQFDLPADIQEDALEDNDSIDSASDLRAIEGSLVVDDLTIDVSQGTPDPDFYSFTILTSANQNHSVEIEFVHAQADLNLIVRDESGSAVGEGNSTTNDERVSLNGFSAGTYTIEVNGNSSASYDLIVEAPFRAPEFTIDVVFTDDNLSDSQRAVFTTAANRWSEVIVADVPDVRLRDGTLVDDIRIEASAPAIDGPGQILGQAGPREFRTGSAIPALGIMQFDVADIGALEENGGLFNVILHEMGHVLGFGTLWDFRGFVDGIGGNDPQYNGENGNREYQDSIGGTGTTVPVANTGGVGTRDSHWRESTFNNELMTGFLNAGDNPLSRMTVGALEDLGYQVNYDAADPYTPPSASLLAAEGEDEHDDDDHEHGEFDFHLDHVIVTPDADTMSRPLVAPLSQAFAPDDYEGTTLVSLRESQIISNLTLDGSATNEDTFAFTMDGLGTAEHAIVINADVPDRTLDLELRTAAGELLSSGLTNGQRISLAGYPAGDYEIRVTGNFNAYDLTLEFQEVNEMPELSALDIDGDGEFNTVTDYRLASLVRNGAPASVVETFRGPDTTRTGQEIIDYVQAMGDALDIDGDGTINTVSDRRLASLSRNGAPAVVLEGFRAPNASRTGDAIAGRVSGLLAAASDATSSVVLAPALRLVSLGESEQLSIATIQAEGEDQPIQQLSAIVPSNVATETPFTITIDYRTLNAMGGVEPVNTSSIGFRVHFDSSELLVDRGGSTIFEQFNETNGLDFAAFPENGDNVDSDPDTDSYFVFTWADNGDGFPGVDQPTDLLNLVASLADGITDTSLSLIPISGDSDAAFEQQVVSSTIVVSTTPPADPTVSVAVAPDAVAEDGTGALTYTFTRSGDTTNELNVSYDVTGDATSGTDFDAVSGTVTIAAGSSTGTVVINPTDDAEVEMDETIILTVTDGANYDVGATPAATGTITNDDQVAADPTVSVAVDPVSVAEDGTAALTYTFTRSGDATNALNVTYTVGGSATSGTDFTAQTGTISIDAGSTTGTVGIDPTDDTEVEIDETIVLTVTDGANYDVGATSAATGTIINDDQLPDPTVSVAVAPSAVSESGNATLTYTFMRSGDATNALNVTYTVGGTATSGTDFSALPGTVTIAAGSMSAMVAINPTEDANVEGDETIILTVTDGANYDVGATPAATGTITDSTQSPDPTVSVTVGPAAVAEDGTDALTYTFTRSGDTTNALNVTYTVGGTAASGTDFAALSGSVSIAAGSTTGTVTIDPNDDTDVESDETIILTVTDGANYDVGNPSNASGTITNDDAVVTTPTVVFVTGGQSLLESSGAFSISVSLSQSSSTAISIPFTVTGNGTNDLTIDASPLVIPAGQTSGSITGSIINDAAVETDESVTVQLGNADGFDLGALVSHTVTILDDDSPTTPSGTRFVTLDDVTGLQVVPGDGRHTAVLMQAIQDTVLSVGSVGTASALPEVRIVNSQVSDIGVSQNGLMTATLSAGQMYAVIINPQTEQRLFAIRSSAGQDAISGQPATNMLNPTDVNGDGATLASDALMVINQLASARTAEGEQAPNGTLGFFDVNGDGKTTALDALNVINRLVRDSAERELVVSSGTIQREGWVWADDVRTIQTPESFDIKDYIFSADQAETRSSDSDDAVADQTQQDQASVESNVDALMQLIGLE